MRYLYSVILIAKNFHGFQYVFNSNICRKIPQINSRRYFTQRNINGVDIFAETLARRICNVIPGQDIISMTLQTLIIIATIYQKKSQADSSKFPPVTIDTSIEKIKQFLKEIDYNFCFLTRRSSTNIAVKI